MISFQFNPKEFFSTILTFSPILLFRSPKLYSSKNRIVKFNIAPGYVRGKIHRDLKRLLRGLIMPNIEPFEKYSQQYDEWFIKNQNIYLAELEAIKALMPSVNIGIEVGVGTGRFAKPLGIKLGIEPSYNMGRLARNRGIEVCSALAEDLPFKHSTFDLALMVTTICFVDNIKRAFEEIYRILKDHGVFLIGFVDKDSLLGRSYQLRRASSKFYKQANFYSVNQVLEILKTTKFQSFAFKQTVFPPKTERIHQVEDGYGKGSFIVIRTIKNG
jgi:ubiquinone/menaquinone biosynthesis C-methylase UbiE